MAFFNMFYLLMAGSTLVFLILFYKAPDLLENLGLQEKYMPIMTYGFTKSIFFYVSPHLLWVPVCPFARLVSGLHTSLSLC